MENTLTGIYKGIVTNSIPDPERRLRVQVFVPFCAARFFEGWDKELEERYLRNPLEFVIKLQKKLTHILPWAECAAPVWGGGTSMRVNSTTQRVTVNGGVHLIKPGDEKVEKPNVWKVATVKEKRTYVLPMAPLDTCVSLADNSYNNASFRNGKVTEEQYLKNVKGNSITSQNEEEYSPYKDKETRMDGNEPLYQAVMESGDSTSGNSEKTVLVQQMDYIGWGAKPSNIGTTGSANGMFSVPRMGAKVWVYFMNGDFQRPVYFANVIEPSAGVSV